MAHSVSHTKYLKARELISEAETKFARANLLLKEEDYSGSVEASQHCLELAIKSLYILVNLVPPKTHDPGHQMESIVMKLEEITSHKMSEVEVGPFLRLKYLSHLFSRLHTDTMYGFKGIPASKIFEKVDADYLIQNSLDAYLGSLFVILTIGYGHGFLTDKENKAIEALVSLSKRTSGEV